MEKKNKIEKLDEMNKEIEDEILRNRVFMTEIELEARNNRADSYKIVEIIQTHLSESKHS